MTKYFIVLTGAVLLAGCAAAPLGAAGGKSDAADKGHGPDQGTIDGGVLEFGDFHRVDVPRDGTVELTVDGIAGAGVRIFATQPGVRCDSPSRFDPVLELWPATEPFGTPADDNEGTMDCRVDSDLVTVLSSDGPHRLLVREFNGNPVTFLVALECLSGDCTAGDDGRDPCAGKECSESCEPCAADDVGCLTQLGTAPHFCDMEGNCVAQVPLCLPGNVCDGLTCGDICAACPFGDPDCEPGRCDVNGHCVADPVCPFFPTDCQPLLCQIVCPNGFEQGEDGCPVCRCRDVEDCRTLDCDDPDASCQQCFGDFVCLPPGMLC